MKDILFVNHRTKECGVNQMGQRYFDNLKESQKYQCFYIDVDELGEYEYWVEQLAPAAVVWNFYSGSTMWWLANEVIESHRQHFKQLCIYHELDLMPKKFDLILHQDPISEDSFPHWSLPRSIPVFEKTNHVTHDQSPVFGSFGFGLGGKGFSRLVDQVQEEYDTAFVRLSIPFAAFGDSNGDGARSWAQDARSRIKKSTIEMSISHEFKPESELLRWLSQNDCNCFLYDENYGRGISGVLDYALAVRRPIAITKSYQFKHVWSIDDSFLVENKSLKEILAMGTDHLEKFHQLWSRENFVKSFEQALESLGV